MKCALVRCKDDLTHMPTGYDDAAALEYSFAVFYAKNLDLRNRDCGPHTVKTFRLIDE